MKKPAIIIFILLSTISFAKHKDQYFSNKYGNVKTFVKTGFYNYASTTRVEILGKLAQNLCLKLSYKDTILIEFRHDCTNFYDKMTIVEHGNPEVESLICHNIEKIGEEQKKSYSQIIGNSAICIRQIDTDFDIIKTLKIIEYCILNKFENSKINLHCKSSRHFDNGEMTDIQYLGMPNKMINKIIDSKESKILMEMLNESITFYSNFDVKGFYQDGLYFFETEKLKFTAKTLSYIVNLRKGVLVFADNDSFIYLNRNLTQIKTHHSSIGGDYAYITNTLDPYNSYKLIEDNNIMLYKFNIRERIIFSEAKNEVVEIRK